ncbi:cytochrome c biogenesis protein CcsA [Luteolibacter flavescens]|uniref:Cytochrome c biogenesis protein CcsA n=1 Tax=Luteolibacter flavescens TaxID=1859460 RepID=A0ABT3FRL8_9BACT|nr:cytochrome c biogenesis protein CcsA [Luteolibacter flavescens]MCW1886223.1 cytochrome c biogenesis protein CcsA [Luteolibacter flavescens]
MKNNIIGRWVVFVLGIAAVGWIAATALRDSLAEGEPTKVSDYVPWEEKTLDLASLLPVQDGGRIKPLGTYAGFSMLSLHGARKMEIIGKDGEKVSIKPLAWMLDCMFRPELADQLPTFRVDNSEVLDAVGIKSKGRRDRYSYNDLKPGLDKLRDLSVNYEQIQKQDPKQLRPVESQTLALAYNVRTYTFLTQYLDFARNGLLPASAAKDGKILPVSEVMQAAPKIRAELQATSHGHAASSEVQTITVLIEQAANSAKFGLNLFPPANVDDPQWLSAGDRIFHIFTGHTREPEQSIKDIKLLEDVCQSLKEGQSAFREKFTAWETSIVERAEKRGEYRSIPLEADYFKKNWFIYALVWFLLATVTSAVMFFAGRTKAGRISYWATVSFLGLGLVYMIIPIVKRSIIMLRPPVGNLYDTIIFIGAFIVLFGLLVEWMTKKRFVVGITPIVAAFLIVLARRFEVGEGKDHLDPLVAVLRSNYWLTIHVITITVGYAAGLITALLSIVYVMMRSLGLDGGDVSLRRSITRAVYGCVCLTLTLSLIGTVLGGVWANDSWGRFWGWDPKENGALMIVLWSLAILHARLGGYIKDWGLHLASIFGAMVVGFSWWHVNFLNVGLHNYGFSAEKIWAVRAFYGIMMGFIVWGAIACLLERMNKTAAKDKANREKAEDEMPVPRHTTF